MKDQRRPGEITKSPTVYAILSSVRVPFSFDFPNRSCNRAKTVSLLDHSIPVIKKAAF